LTPEQRIALAQPAPLLQMAAWSQTFWMEAPTCQQVTHL
jgi:hypothetical protein